MNDNHSLCPIPKSVAQDKNLSLKAKGLYWLIENYIESPTFDSSHFKPVLLANCKESSAAFDSAWKELKYAGYLKQHCISRSNGGNKGFHYEYELTDTSGGAE